MSFAAVVLIYLLVLVGIYYALCRRGDGSLRDYVLFSIIAVLWPVFVLVKIGYWIGGK